MSSDGSVEVVSVTEEHTARYELVSHGQRRRLHLQSTPRLQVAVVTDDADRVLSVAFANVGREGLTSQRAYRVNFTGADPDSATQAILTAATVARLPKVSGTQPIEASFLDALVNADPDAGWAPETPTVLPRWSIFESLFCNPGPVVAGEADLRACFRALCSFGECVSREEPDCSTPAENARQACNILAPPR